MKEWWNQLSLRDKRAACLGAAAIVLALLYTVLWLPLANKNELLRTQIQHDKKLLVWMQAADKKIQALKQHQKTRAISHANTSALSTVQEQLKNSDFAKQFSQLKQGDNDTVLISFQSVNFDHLINWLTMLWQEETLVVIQAAIKPTNSSGIVNADLILTTS